MGKKFAVFDIDGTLIRWQLYHAIVSELARGKHLAADAEKTINDARMTWKKRKHEVSFRDYERTLIRVYYDALHNISINAYEAAVEAVFEEYKDQVYTYTRDLVKELKDKDYTLIAISGSHDEVVKKLAAYYGFDQAFGTVYTVKDGRFTGEEHGHLHKKHLVLQELIASHSLNIDDSIAVGDSEGDISMLEMVDKPIAFNPTKGLLEHAKTRGWKIVVERKNVVYEMEPRDEAYVLAHPDR